MLLYLNENRIITKHFFSRFLKNHSNFLIKTTIFDCQLTKRL